MKKKARVIAFYLPQFHPTPDNDKWWGNGFTEWTNVGKAKPLFKGHYQPRIPADLGYYDLRVPEVRDAQATMAHDAGIEGFCYYHYWFGGGKQELELPFNEVVKLGKPDFPFCLCWANESWEKKFWNKDGTYNQEILIKQEYQGEEDHKKHFYSLLSAFHDKRYLKIEDRLIFMIYKPLKFPNVDKFMNLWNKLSNLNGLKGFYFIGQSMKNKKTNDIDKILSLGFDSINVVRLDDVDYYRSFFRKLFDRGIRIFTGMPRIYLYKNIYHSFIANEEIAMNIYPTIIPNWDHSPRSGRAGFVILNSTPSLFEKHIDEVLSIIKLKDEEHKIIFLKSWNEWGEGNYVEPDLKFGKKYLFALKNKIIIPE